MLHILQRGIRSGEPGERAVALLAETARARGHEVVCGDLQAAADDPAFGTAPGAVAIVRADLRSEHDLAETTDAVVALEKRGVRCLPRSEGLVAGEDRLRTFVRLRVAGIASPSTIAVCVAREGPASVASFYGRMGAFPVLVRRRVGRGHTRAADSDGLEEELRRLHRAEPDDAVLLQPWVAHEDIVTAIVAAGRVRSTWGAAAGGALAPTTESPEGKTILLAIAAAETCNLSVARVDFVRTDTGPVCVGVASMPPLDPVSPADRDFAAALVETASGAVAP